MQLFELFGSIVIDTDKAKKQISDVTNYAKKSGSIMVDAFTKVGRGFGNIAKGIGNVAGAVGVFRAVDGAINAVSNSIGNAVSRVDTLKTFPTILQQMGATSEEAQASIDRLSEGIDGLPTTLDGIASNAQRMFTILGDTDLATESTLALNNAFLASGTSSADASRGMEQYMQMLSAGKVDMQSWRTLQETMPYALKETAEAFGFTGQSATNDFYSALQSGEITMEEFNAKIIELSEGTGGFAEVARTATGGIATSWQNLKTSIVRGVANIISAVDEWMAQNGFGSISEQINNFRGVIDSVFGWIVERVPVVLDTLKGLFDGIKGLFSGEGFGNFDLSGIFDNLTASIPQFIQKGQEIIQGLIQGIAQNAPQITQTLISMIQGWLSNMGTMYPMIIEAGVQLIVALVGGLIQALPAIIDTIITIITSLLDAILNSLPLLINAGMELLLGLIQGLVQAAPNILTAIIDILYALVDAIMENLPLLLGAGVRVLMELIFGIQSMVPELLSAIIKIIILLINTIIDLLPMLLQTGVQILLAFIQGIADNFPQIIQTAIEMIMVIVQAITELLPEIITAGIQIIIALAEGLIQAIPQLVGAIPQIVKAIFDAFANVNWWEIGKNIIDGIAKGIGDFAGNLIAKGKEVAEKALGGIKKFLGIKSPSRVFADEVGKWIPAGIAVGIEENTDLPEDAIKKAISVDNMNFSGTVYSRDKNNETSLSNGGNGITQHITINSPRPLNPLETARQIKKASRQLALNN